VEDIEIENVHDCIKPETSDNHGLGDCNPKLIIVNAEPKGWRIVMVLIIYHAICKYNCVHLFSAVRMVYNERFWVRDFRRQNLGVVSCSAVVLTSHIIQNRYISIKCL